MLTWSIVYMHSVAIARISEGGKLIIPNSLFITAMLIDGLIISVVCYCVAYVITGRRLNKHDRNGI